MKKPLIAMSVLGAFAASATAADIQLYGLINPALTFTSSNGDYAGAETVNTFKMEEGQEFGSRFGIRGMEEISPDFKVGFVLESGFNADTGALNKSTKIFDRESHLDLHTNFGKFSFGTMPIFGSTLGADGLFRAIDPLFANYTEAFGSGLISASDWTRTDNTFSYVTPTFAGLTGYAMYSLKKDGTNTAGEESMAESDRYASLAVRYQNGAFEGIVVGDMTLYGYKDSQTPKEVDNGFTVTVGGNYTFGSGLKLLAFAQYFDDQYINHKARAGVSYNGLVNVSTAGYQYVSGYGLSLGAHYPVGNGTLKGQIGFRDMDNTDDVDFTRWIVALGYDYPLSKRTSFFAMTGYSQEKIENNKTKAEATPYGYELTAGIVHRF